MPQDDARNTQRPAFDTPPHLRCPDAPLVVWFTEPLGMLTQIIEPMHGTPEMATFITGVAWSALLELRGTRRERMIFVHDFTAMDSYDSEARRMLTMWGLSIRADIERIVVIQPPMKNRLARMGIAAAAAALGMLGVELDLDDTLPGALERLALRPLALSA